jgi:hypothetical protein
MLDTSFCLGFGDTIKCRHSLGLCRARQFAAQGLCSVPKNAGEGCEHEGYITGHLVFFRS